ncbi:NlpC/P60 family protein [Marinicrinis lubricantis]|uniref:NlpC/P60 family protein n=1 Tax=Marinicrinis lubricantis TaxID=2086470 RepID=A0ABW1IH75_9BACL
MKKSIYSITAAILSISVVTAACSDQDRVLNNNNNEDARFETQMNTGGNAVPLNELTNRNRSNSQLNTYSLEEDTAIPYQYVNGQPYISLARLLEVTGLNSTYDEQQKKFEIGDHDMVYQIFLNSNQAAVEDRTVSLSQQPVDVKGETYIPVDALGKVFSDQLTFTPQETQVIIHGSGEQNAEIDAGNEEQDDNFFQDDPNDPFKDESVMLPYSTQEDIPALKNINMNTLINRAKRYLGVDYDFGAKPYPRSKRFDCSSYVQYLFGKQGVDLPRTARAQARRGVSVSRKNLRKGDLLFFYVPGRFKTNKTVGHVGIYMGNQKMIHSSPSPKNGVQITNINKSYWKKTYLRSRRVAR